MKKTILLLTFLAGTFGATAQTILPGTPTGEKRQEKLRRAVEEIDAMPLPCDRSTTVFGRNTIRRLQILSDIYSFCTGIFRNRIISV